MSNAIEELRELVNSQGTTQHERIARLFGGRCYDGSDLFKGGPPVGLGGDEKAQPPYPAASLPFYDTTTLSARTSALKTARVENTFNSTLLAGAVIHGNVTCKDVKLSKVWRFRGGLDEREENFGVIDSNPDFHGVLLLEGTIAYLGKHFDTIVYSTDIAAKFITLLGIIYSSFADNNLGRITTEIVDPILLAFPHRKCRNIDELDFYPTFCADHPQYKQRMKQWPKASFDKDHLDDDLLSWFMTAAPTPVFDFLKPYTKHQANFPITNDQFTKVKGFEFDSLDNAMADNRLFIVDFKDYSKQSVAARNWDNYGARLHASICLFAIPVGKSTLKPVAIQQTQTPKESGFWADISWTLTKIFGYGNQGTPASKIVTPADNKWAWQMAKTGVTTMTSMASVIDHLSSHVYLGPVAVSIFRNLPEQHPLRSLLDTHIMGLTTNNHTGIFEETGVGIVAAPTYGNPLNGFLTGSVERISGFSSESFLSAVIQRKDHYDFVEHSTPFDRKADPKFSKIDTFPQHDDNKLMPIIKEWVEAYIRLYYLNDNDVERDPELQAFLLETARDGKVNGFPDNAKTIGQVTDIISRVIYWMSVNHGFASLVSYMKLGALGYYSNYPVEPSQNYSEKDWLYVCPPMNVGTALFFFSRIFTDLPEDWHRSLGKYPKGQFKHDTRVYGPLEVFQNKMKALDDELRATNSNRRWTYDLRMPSTITVSPWN